MASTTAIVTVLLLVSGRVKADGRSEGKTCIDCPYKAPSRPTPSGPSSTTSGSTSGTTTQTTTDSGDGDDGDDGDSGDSGESASTDHYYDPKSSWRPHEHRSHTRTVYRRPTQNQSFVYMANGGYVPLVNGLPQGTSLDDAPVPTGPINSFAGVSLPSGPGVAYHAISAGSINSLPNSAARVELIGHATAAQQVNSQARINQGNLAPVMRNVVNLATTLDDPSATIASVQHAATGLFGADHLAEWNAEIVSAPQRISESVDDVMRELQEVWAGAMRSAASSPAPVEQESPVTGTDE